MLLSYVFYRYTRCTLSMRYQCTIYAMHFIGTLFDVLHRFANADTFAKKIVFLKFFAQNITDRKQLFPLVCNISHIWHIVLLTTLLRHI